MTSAEHRVTATKYDLELYSEARGFLNSGNLGESAIYVHGQGRDLENPQTHSSLVSPPPVEEGKRGG